ncbi:hypothetical protein Ahy_A02g006921 [Arachis hypogaea]|uniref:Pentatricopeptide repeat-containing protein n=2 Tax=Arachis hypogaea TaxID=3818 RepID=A0A445EBJ6_ARAHY|nr:hypothetical protein Ahy_A02g006921 [Arachis hypogaea]
MQWLERAYELVDRAIEEGKQILLEKGVLIYLSFGLAKVGLPVLASTILRKMIDMELFPPVNAWSAVLAHMSQTADGSYLAAELILEIGYLFQNNRVDPRKKSNAPLIAMKPNATAFNIALAGCLLFETSRKAEQLLDLMPRIGAKADANLLIIMAHVYERNGRREELKKLQRHIEEAPNLTDVQFRQFYNCLLTCHLKLGDLESASNMVLEMLRKAKEARNSLATAKFMVDAAIIDNKYSPGLASPQSLRSNGELDSFENNKQSCNDVLCYKEFSRDRNFLKLEAESKAILDSLLAKLQVQIDLITTVHGILQPTEMIYVKLVKAFLEAGKTKDLAVFLLKAEREDSPFSNDSSALVHVISSCISLGWLDQAHDLLDEMRLAGVKTGSSVYTSLLKAYCRANRVVDVTSLLRDAKKVGIQLDSSCYEAMIQSKVIQQDTHGALQLFKEMKEARIPKVNQLDSSMLAKPGTKSDEAALMKGLLQEIKEGQRVDYGVHDWNNVIHFFCKKRLMQDAEKALKKMRILGHTPNAQTFHSMVTGYAAVGGKYHEVTELWGEMKSLASAISMKFDQELLDSVLYTFVRGGFFARANEVVTMMEKGNMFVDKYKYRMLFLKYHKTLYKGKAPKIQTESQLKKREAALECGMASQEEQKIPIKVFIDKQHNKVVAVESTKDFVDTLFSFLSLPLATIIRLLTNHHQQQPPPPPLLGCITNLYQSVENLTQNDVWNSVCKHMLLFPRNPCDSLCWKLFFNIDDTEPSPRFLVCEYCTSKFTTFRNLICACGNPVNGQPHDLDWELRMKSNSNNNGHVNVDDSKCGVFVKENGSLFLVFDDLAVVPSSLVTSVQMLHQLGYSDLTQLEQVTRTIGKDEILNLLKYTLTSYEPLTNMVLASDSKKKDKPLNPFASAIRVMRPATSESKMDIKILQSKSQNKIMFAEAKEDFVDFMFSLLTIPLGSIVKQLGGNTSVGCVDNLYKSVETLDSSWCTDSRSVLLNPGVAPQYSCPNQLLNIPEEELPTYYYGKGTYEPEPNPYYSNRKREVTWTGGVISKSNSDIAGVKLLTALDPRSPKRLKESAVGFVRRPALYAVGDDLRVRPLSGDSCISYLKELNVPIDDLEIKVISIGEAEALSLLGASLTSKQALTTGLQDFLDVPRQESNLASKYMRTSRLDDLLKEEPNPEP